MVPSPRARDLRRYFRQPDSAISRPRSTASWWSVCGHGRVATAGERGRSSHSEWASGSIGAAARPPARGVGRRGSGITANYTIVDQKGEGQVPAVAVGVAPETYNATIYYENHGISARLSTTFSQGSAGVESQPERHPPPRCSTTTTSSGTSRPASTSRRCSAGPTYSA